MRAIPLLFTLLLAAAQAAEPTKPTVPPPPPMPTSTPEDEAAIEPEVTIVQREGATHTEYRLGGKLYMIRVKPAIGPEYLLVDDDGKGSFVRRDNEPKVRPPRWVIKRF